MTTFLQLHFLTAYPPSNLNRDDLGRPKTAIVGGTTRLRVSSQSLKRAWRTSAVFSEHLEGNVGTRTKEIGIQLFDRLVKGGVAEKRSKEVAQQIAGHFGKLQKDERDKPQNGLRSEQLFHFSPRELKVIDGLLERTIQGEVISGEDITASLKSEGGAADVALFGRMLASKDTKEDYTIEAAAQVAHAFSVQRVSIEDDFFTAVDDLNTGEGAGHMGVTEFSSGLFYGYVCVDEDLLIENLKGDKPLARATLHALVESLATVSPTGKQNSFASRAYCSYLLAERGSRQPRSLSVAFLAPVTDYSESGGSSGMLDNAVARLDDTRAKMDRAFGPCASSSAVMNVLAEKGTLEEVLRFTSEAVNG